MVWFGLLSQRLADNRALAFSSSRSDIRHATKTHKLTANNNRDNKRLGTLRFRTFALHGFVNFIIVELKVQVFLFAIQYGNFERNSKHFKYVSEPSSKLKRLIVPVHVESIIIPEGRFSLPTYASEKGGTETCVRSEPSNKRMAGVFVFNMANFQRRSFQCLPIRDSNIEKNEKAIMAKNATIEK